jgi:hypothetical protein
MTTTKHSTVSLPPRIDLSGQPFGSLTARRYLGRSRWECLCACGRTTNVTTDHLTRGHTRSCGCQHHPPIPKLDLSGQPFGRLVAQRYIAGSRWECLCKCGCTTIVATRELISGGTKSCGCLVRDNAGSKPIHGLTQHPIFSRWTSMLDRCCNPRHRQYKHYGGRGITVCERWRESVVHFYADMGDPPPGMSLERRNNNLGYSPENCYWATPQQQLRNTRVNHILTYNGESHPIIVWAEKLNVTWDMLASRVKRGWSDEKTLTTPPKFRRTR